MRQVTVEELYQMANDARDAIWGAAQALSRDPKVYLHWTAGHYDQCFDDYHINITGDGTIYVSTDDLSEIKSHTWRRNTGSVGITLCCAYRGGTDDLGSEPPTNAQIEAMAQAIAAVASGLWLTIDMNHVMTHGEAADNADGLEPHEPYGPLTTVERWDLQYLGTPDSPVYIIGYYDERTGGNVLRGKANWYNNQRSY